MRTTPKKRLYSIQPDVIKCYLIEKTAKTSSSFFFCSNNFARLALVANVTPSPCCITHMTYITNRTAWTQNVPFAETCANSLPRLLNVLRLMRCDVWLTYSFPRVAGGIRGLKFSSLIVWRIYPTSADYFGRSTQPRAFLGTQFFFCWNFPPVDFFQGV